MFTNKGKFNYLIIFYLLFSFLGGALGAFIIFMYLINSLNFNSVFENESFANMLSRLSSQKVVIKQDQAYDMILGEVKYSIVDIYLKQENNPKEMGNISQAGKFSGKGIILTTDGWIVSNIKNEAKITDYIVFVNTGKTIKRYVPDRILNDKFDGLNYIKIPADGLSILPLGEYEGIKNGEIVMSVGYNNRLKIDYIAEAGYNIPGQENFSKSSDVLNRGILLGGVLERDNYYSSPLINLDRELVGIMNTENTAIPAYTIKKAFRSIIKFQQISRPSLGLEYIDLNYITEYNGISKGSLIYKILPKGKAQVNGLKEGDVILKVEDSEVKENNLSELIQDYDTGTEINLLILRDKREIKKKITI